MNRFLLLVSALALAGCATDLQKDGANIKSLYFDHVPTSAIKVGEFDAAGIILHVDYSDRTSSEFPVTEDWLPEQYLHFLGEAGSYYVNILFRGKTVGLQFEMAENPIAPKYSVTFLDYKGKELTSYTISHRKDAYYDGELPAKEGYVFKGWDKSLYGVCRDMVYRPIYEVAP